ncbi:MAG TPA: Crp/Fnr family transcriptional regulator [Actinomycetota bacterium]|nr:Crp/Fnr family transcriptional regulator [Actinomycetota bacterium]
MKAERAAKLLGGSNLFADLDEETLLKVADRLIERSYKKGQVIFYQGDLGDSLFLVAEGLVKVMVTSPDGEEMVLTTVRPPDIFGELAVFDGGQRSASAEALEATTTLGLTRETFLTVLQEHPRLQDALLRSLGNVLRRLTEQASDLVFLDLHGRVAKLLLGLADDRGEKQGDETLLDLRMTQADLAAMVGGSRQRVNVILRSFEDRGYLALEGRKIKLIRADLLKRRASA